MERKLFLRKGMAALGVAFVAPLALGCRKSNDESADSGSESSSGSGSNNGSCTASPTETEGPFPTKTPSGLQRTDIRDDRTGVALAIEIAIRNLNNSCAVLAGAIVDIWHCDKDGYYSEYGGTGMQSVNYTSVHFLRGGAR